MGRFTQRALISGATAVLAAALGGCAPGAKPPQASAPPRTIPAKADAAYQAWVQQFSEPALKRQLLLIKTVEYAEPGSIYGDGQSYTTSSWSVGPKGTTSRLRDQENDSYGFNGAIAPKDFARLKQLIVDLPSDHSYLPPPERRMLMQAFVNNRWSVRVLDRANFSDRVLEILRLCQADITVWTPEFQAKDQLASYGGVSISPDGTQFVIVDSGLDFYSTVTDEYLGRTQRWSYEASELKFNPDGTTAVAGEDFPGECWLMNARSWQEIKLFWEPFVGRTRLSYWHPLFTPDGKYVFLQCTDGTLRFFDAHTGQRVDPPPGLPADAAQYLPASKGARAVVRWKSGQLCLWNTTDHSKVAVLDNACKSVEAAFSPDGSLLATITVPTGNSYYSRLRIWNARTGDFVRELWVMEQHTPTTFHLPVWTGDSRYLLCAADTSQSGNGYVIDLWNAAAGRDRARFEADYSGDYAGIVLLPHGSQLIAGSSQWATKVWDFAAAMRSIRAIEASFR